MEFVWTPNGSSCFRWSESKEWGAGVIPESPGKGSSSTKVSLALLSLQRSF